MTKTQTTTLTHAQFIAARALASAYNHLWSEVPDSTYDLEQIRTIASEWQHPMLPAGIECPDFEIDVLGDLTVLHTTGSGRLHWKVLQSGNVCLEIYRPADLSPERAHTARTMAYAAISNVASPDGTGICVARIWLINDDDQQYDLQDDYVICTSDYEQGQQTPFIHDGQLCDHLLCGRHVGALIRPLVALITANQQAQHNAHSPWSRENQEKWDSISQEEKDRWREKWEKEHQDLREQVIHPAIEQAKEWLKPLFEVALPDPYYQYNDSDLPETYWTRSDDEYSIDRELAVFHRGESFPVESEKTAVHAVLLLQKDPDMPLIEAIKIATRSNSYRPIPE